MFQVYIVSQLRPRLSDAHNLAGEGGGGGGAGRRGGEEKTVGGHSSLNSWEVTALSPAVFCQLSKRTFFLCGKSAF